MFCSVSQLYFQLELLFSSCFSAEISVLLLTAWDSIAAAAASCSSYHVNKHVVKHLPLPWLVGISILASTGVRSGQETCIASHLGSFGGSAVIVLCHRVFSSTFRVHPFKSQCSLQSTLWVGTFSPVPKKPPASAQLQCSLRRTYFLLGTVGSGGLILLVEILLISTGQKRKEEFRGLLMVSPDQYVPS